MEVTSKQNNISDLPTIMELRKALVPLIAQDFANLGYKADSKLNYIRRKTGKGDEQKISLNCYDHKPVRIEFRLIIQVAIKRIDDETKKFYEYLNEQYNGGPTIILCEGDFHHKVKHLEPKLRNAATHIISNKSEMKEAIEDCRKVLGEEIAPQLEAFSDFDRFQDYILKDYDAILRLQLVEPSLMAAKLHSRTELVRLVNYLWDALNLASMNEANYTRRFVENLIPYSDRT
ncbi:MAG TPA: hypothetical protein VM935_18010 [Chitinophagaceae bacterium]|jgi:hypothetical protein|nr:hypothetical protein [Chitinophagaceae bacterium]